MNRAAAWELLNEYTKNPSLIKHMLAVEAAMRAYARKLGQDEEKWGIIGLLHDFEYERWPKVGDILEGRTVISDVYEKERSNGGKLEFYVTETDWKDATSGEPVVKSIFTLVINVRPQS